MAQGRRSLSERLEMRAEIISKAFELSMNAHKFCGARSDEYLSQEIHNSVEIVFAFPGSWSVNEWFSCRPFGEIKIDLSLFPCLRSIGNQESAFVNEAFFREFIALLRTSRLAIEVEKAVKDKKHVVFAGHSSGGSLAMLTTVWFLERYTRKNGATTPRCVTFGSPLIGDHIFSHAIRRENWGRCFINFVTKYDIVPLTMLTPLSLIHKTLPRILDFHCPKSEFYKHMMISTSSAASSFYLNVLTQASLVASYVASSFRGSTNILVGNFSKFVELSPYRPFGTYIFCDEDKTSFGMENPDAILQTLFYFSRLSTEEEGPMVACLKLNANMRYEVVLDNCLKMQNFVYLENASDLEAEDIKDTLHDLGLDTRAILSLYAALGFEKQKMKNEAEIEKEIIEKDLCAIQKYKMDCELSKVGYYDAFKMQNNESGFKADVARLELAGIWDEIVDMVKRGEFPDNFEGKKEWIELGTKFRRLLEPLDVANYYMQGRNDDAGSYLIKGRPRRYKFPQRWHEHDKRMVRYETISESCFLGEVEEIKFVSKKTCYEDIKERIVKLEGQVLDWCNNEVLDKDVILESSTFTQWWKSLPDEHKLASCIKHLFVMT
ncbi:hypothetical protein ACET3Z_021241 [Daucus carota]